jgi:AraC-like DNA-binding protein
VELSQKLLYVIFSDADSVKKLAEHVQVISEMLGYCSQSYFAEMFRKVAGMTPNEYRMKIVGSE